MKTPILLALALATVSVHGQSMEELMKRAMEQSQGAGGIGGVSIEENNDPFEPIGFTGSYRMEVHSFKNGAEEKDSPMNVRMAFTDDKVAMAPEMPGKGKESMRMIYNLKEKSTYTLMTDEKGQRTGMKMKMMKVNVKDDGTAKDDKSGKVVRTDETKTIDGHTCRKYTFTDETGAGEAWIAEDVDFDPFRAMGSIMGGNKMEKWQQTPYSGMLMESTWTDAKGKDKMTMYTKDLVVGKVNDDAFSTAGYQIQDMSAFPMFGK